MCRMMGMVGAPGREVLEEFRALAGNGNVLPGNSGGHGDGWGISAYRDGRLAFLEKSGLSAVEDARYEAAEGSVDGAGIVVAHLRKASVGDVRAVNAHPFHRDGVTFCHNGGVRRSEELPLYGLTPEGDTDSERFFLSILGRMKCGEASNLSDAARQAIDYIHRNHTYSSISFLLTDGQALMAYRDFRTVLRPEETTPPDSFDEWHRYYTLFYSPSRRAVSSQPLASLADDWRLLDNQCLFTL